jgi:ABC-type glycerol-3-phosphate transport system substrate-binding protein
MAPLSAKASTIMRTLIVAVLATAAVLLLAFGPRPGEELPRGFVIVDYWEKWTGIEEAAMREIVNDFNNTIGREKRVFVRYLSTSAVVDKTLIATAGGVPPDIAGLYNQNIPQFAVTDALEPLEDLAAAHGITEQIYKKVFWDECHYEGRLYGLVSTAFDLALYYNTEIFQQRAAELRARGLDPDRAPRTIAELDAYAQALDTFDSSGRIELAGFLPMEPGWYLNYNCIWFGGKWWDKTNRRFTFTDPGVVRCYQWVQSYLTRLGKQAVANFRAGFGNFDSPQNAFLAPTVAMEQQGTFFANYILNRGPRMEGKWAVAPFPSWDPNSKDVTYCNCDVLVIPRGARHKREAFEFIAYLHRQEVMEKLADLHCKLSPLAKVSEQFFEKHRNPYIRVFDTLAASPNAHPTEPIPILPQVEAEMNNFIQGLVQLDVTPEQGLREMQQRLQREYDSLMQEQRERRTATAR